MIEHNESNRKSYFSSEFKALKIGKLLSRCNISRGSQGFSALYLFGFFIELVFHNKNLYRLLNSSRNTSLASKNTYYRFLNDASFNWYKFIMLLAADIITFFTSLTSEKRVKTFVLDDSIYSRDRSKRVELLSNVYDHVSHSHIKGFTMLTLGWTDGFSFVPVSFRLLSSPNKNNRYNSGLHKLDKRTLAYKRRKESMEHKPAVSVSLISEALNHGIQADYVLMDTWFTNEPMLKSVTELGIDVIGMVKALKQTYTYKGQKYTLTQLKKLVEFTNCGDIMGSITVTTKNGIPVKIVFIKHRTNRRKVLCLLSTDLSLENQEIIRIYGNRWSIETFFKDIKSHFKLADEIQSRNYDALIAHTSIVFSRYMLITWRQRNYLDDRTIGEMFYYFCDEISDISYSEAISSLFEILQTATNSTIVNFIDYLKSQLQLWFDSQPSYIKALMPILMWES